MGMILEGKIMETNDDCHGSLASTNFSEECLGCAEHGFVPMWRQWRRKRFVWALRETINCRFKQFTYLYHIYQHDVFKHSYYFRSVITFTQIGISIGKSVGTVREIFNTIKILIKVCFD